VVHHQTILIVDQLDQLFMELDGKDWPKLITARRERIAYTPCAKLLLWDNMSHNSRTYALCLPPPRPSPNSPWIWGSMR
jgi:hypothetical protein